MATSNKQVVFEEIGRQMGLSAAGVQKALSKGQVSADVGVFAIVKALERAGGGQVGGLLIKQADTLTGMLSALKSSVFDFWASLNIQGGGIAIVRDVFKNLLTVFDATTPAGARFSQILQKTADSALELLKPLTGPQGLKTLTSTFKKAASGVLLLGDALMFVGKLFASLIEAYEGFQNVDWAYIPDMAAKPFVQAWNAVRRTVTDGLDWVSTQFKNAGGAIMEALATSIEVAITNPINAIQNASTKLIQAFKNMLGIHSPSAVFQKLGESTGEGYARGLVNSLRHAREATAPLLQFPQTGTHRQAGNVWNVSIAVDVDASGNDAAAVAQHIQETLQTEFGSALEKLAIEGGVA